MQEPQPTTAPARVLGVFDATCIVVGAIIGTGIFFTPSTVARTVETSGLALTAWGVGGFIALCGALTFGELGARYTGEAAQYQVLRDAYGKLVAFLFVFCNATAVQAGSIAIIAIICVQNLSVGLAGAGAPLDGPWLIGVSTALIVLVCIANMIGVRAGATIQNVTAVAKVATLVVIIVLGVMCAPEHHAVAAPGKDTSLPGGWGVLAALVPVFFTFGGWQQALWISGEVKSPQRNLPRAIIGGVLLVIAVYVLASWAYFRLLSFEEVRATKVLAADAVASVFPSWGRRAVSIAVGFSAFGVLNAQLLAGPRLISGMSRARQFFAVFGRIHPRFGTPTSAIILMTIAGLAVLWAGGMKGADTILNGTVMIDGVFFAFTGAALIVLRTRARSEARGEGFRAPLFPVVPALFVIGELGVVAGSFQDPDKRNTAYLAAVWIVAAAVVYFVFIAGRKEPTGETSVPPKP